MKFAVILCLVLVLLACADAQRSRNRGRGRNRNRNRGADQCHMKEVDKCVDKITALAKGSNPTQIITTSAGLDRICTTFEDVMKCFKTYMKKCGTPLQRELFDFGTEYFVRTIKQFCDPGPDRENFLANSPCIHSKVLTSAPYRNGCNNNYLGALEHITNVTGADDRLDTMCCAHNTWESCTTNLVNKECGTDAKKAFTVFIEKAFGGMATMICPQNIFPVNSKTCKSALPPKSFKAKGKLSDNPIAKYISSYFGFLFATN